MAACLSNLRPLGHAFSMYVGENKKAYAYHATDEGFWMNQLRNYYGDVGAVRYCPEATEYAGGWGWGGTRTAWGPNVFASDGSHGFNGWVYHLTGGYENGQISNAWPNYKD